MHKAKSVEAVDRRAAKSSRRWYDEYAYSPQQTSEGVNHQQDVKERLQRINREASERHRSRLLRGNSITGEHNKDKQDSNLYSGSSNGFNSNYGSNDSNGGSNNNQKDGIASFDNRQTSQTGTVF